jgi:hypothetical protein
MKEFLVLATHILGELPPVEGHQHLVDCRILRNKVMVHDDLPVEQRTFSIIFPLEWSCQNFMAPSDDSHFYSNCLHQGFYISSNHR